MNSLSNELIGLRVRAKCLLRQSRVILLLAMLAGAALFCVMSDAALAAPINYGDFSGQTVWFRNVIEDTNSGDTQPLYGAPTVSGDSLDFDPVGFDANATGADGVDVTEGQLHFEIEAKYKTNIPSVIISEAGDTTLSGFGTDATFTAVTADVFADIIEVNGVLIDEISVNGSLVFAPSAGDYGLATDGGGGPLYHTIWTGSLVLDLDAVLAANNIDGGATHVKLNIDNTLTALSEDGTFALIAKKDFGGLTITVPGPNPGGTPVIPEPASVMLAALGLLGVVAGRRLERR